MTKSTRTPCTSGKLVGRVGFEPTKPTVAVLQTACFNHLHICLYIGTTEWTWTIDPRFIRPKLLPTELLSYLMVYPKGFEPLTHRLKICCSTNWTMGTYGLSKEIWTPDPLFPKQVFFQLNYAQIYSRHIFIDLSLLSPTELLTEHCSIRQDLNLRPTA